MKGQEIELLEGFRRLCPANKSSILAMVSMAVSAENAVRREIDASFEAPSMNYLSKAKALSGEPVTNSNLGGN